MYSFTSNELNTAQLYPNLVIMETETPNRILNNLIRDHSKEKRKEHKITHLRF